MDNVRERNSGGYIILFFFYRKFQPMTSASDNSFLSSNQDTDHFLV